MVVKKIVVEKCKAILDVRYRWVGIIAIVAWACLMPLLINYITTGVYFAVFTTILLINAFFTIDTCMTPKNLVFAILPYILPIAGFITIVLISSTDGLQLLGVTPTNAENASADINYILGAGFIEVATKKAPTITWMAFVPLYILGFALYAWADSTGRTSMKGIATILMLSPIMIQLTLGFTYNKSYGLLGSIGEIDVLLSYLGDIAGPLTVIIGSVLDFIIVSLLLGIEHAIVEPEETPT